MLSARSPIRSSSDEIFMAVVAERTRHIRLGTGVSSLPYHHPLMLL
ncbi:LLM class flavin-dependent oxidoreductase, partial [Nitrospirales bacterium NOB]|nr:LLM class flavin-dependent oxidoreductase [Nitrospirales bacterium NOB]